MQCTWKDCSAEAVTPLTGMDGTEWAALCTEHAAEFEELMGAMDAQTACLSEMLMRLGACNPVGA